MNLKKILFFFLILNANPFSLPAKSNPDIFIISNISPHVYIAHPGRTNRINSTSTIIVSTHFLTVIESQTDEFMAGALIREIRQRISKLPIKYLIFSHFHLDHILGAGAFLRENPALIIIAQQKTAEHISMYGKEDQESWGTAVFQKSDEVKISAKSAKTEQQKNYFSRTSNDLEAYYRDIKSSVITPPNLVFRDTLTISDNDLSLQLSYLGAGHTSGDIVIFIPQDKVLVTGDLVHDYEPLFWDADPDSWIQVLDKINRIDFDYFVGGHGDKHKGREIVYAWENYLKELIAKTREAIREKQTLENFQRQITAEMFISLQNGYGQRIQQFREGYMEYFIGPLTDAIKGEIGFLWKFYAGRNQE
jgi:glyoxylase-like metal-dependent hydrolase (beta-lactamase superfamily II)